MTRITAPYGAWKSPITADLITGGSIGITQVSLDGGRSPRWRKDGTELYYIADSGMLMKVRVSAASETFEAGRPEPLFQTPFDTGMQYDVFPTQEHVDTNGTDVPFLFMDNRQPPETPISVILNWQRLLDDRR